MKYIFAILLLIAAKFACADDNYSITLTQSSSDKNTSSKGALLQYTSPEDGDDSYSIDAALSFIYKPASSTTSEYSIVVEGHKNTLTDSEQDTLSYKLNGFFNPICYKHLGGGICAKKINSTVSLEHKSNFVDDTDSIQVVNEWYALDKDLRMFEKPGDTILQLNPKIGLEYEDITDSDEAKNGTEFRLFSQFEVELVPFPKNEELKKFSLVWTYQYWESFGESGVFEELKGSYFSNQYKLKYKILEKKEVETSLEFIKFKGSNPRTSLDFNEYRQLGISIKLNFS